MVADAGFKYKGRITGWKILEMLKLIPQWLNRRKSVASKIIVDEFKISGTLAIESSDRSNDLVYYENEIESDRDIWGGFKKYRVYLSFHPSFCHRGRLGRFTVL